jgi:hypothetical protein
VSTAAMQGSDQRSIELALMRNSSADSTTLSCLQRRGL